eukprot:gene7928-biopygen163
MTLFEGQHGQGKKRKKTSQAEMGSSGVKGASTRELWPFRSALGQGTSTYGINSFNPSSIPYILFYDGGGGGGGGGVCSRSRGKPLIHHHWGCTGVCWGMRAQGTKVCVHKGTNRVVHKGHTLCRSPLREHWVFVQMMEGQSRIEDVRMDLEFSAVRIKDLTVISPAESAVTGEECIEIWFGGEAPKPYVDALLPSPQPTTLNCSDKASIAYTSTCMSMVYRIRLVARESV